VGFGISRGCGGGKCADNGGWSFSRGRRGLWAK